MYIRKNWIYLNLGKFLYLDISSPRKTIKKLKGVFKPLRCYFNYSFTKWNPYPILWVSKPAFIQIIAHDVGWKDKYNTPRFEALPYVWIHIYKFNLVWYWSLSLHQERLIEDYWKQALWYLYYYNNTSYGCDCPNIEKAKESWPWQDYKTGKSSWIEEILIKN